MNTTHRSTRIGILHSVTGIMANSERQPIDGVMMAVDEINESGGVLGCQVETVMADGASSPEVFADKAREFISSGISTIFGCWTSASRKSVKPFIESGDALLWYPVQYEGLESSNNIVYLGSSLNQQITPAIEWILEQIGQEIFFVGSDYVFPRASYKILKTLTEDRGGSIVGEHFFPLKETDFSRTIEEIHRKSPSAVFNTINGQGNLEFFRQYHAGGLRAEDIPILSTSVTEIDLAPVLDCAEGHLACWSYFHNLNTQENRGFLKRFAERFGGRAICTDPLVAAYYQVFLWKRAVETAGSFEPTKIIPILPGCAANGPLGRITLKANHHIEKHAHIGKLSKSGLFEIVWSTPAPIPPQPWLGMENIKHPARHLVMKSMAAFSEQIHYNAQLKVINDKLRQSESDLSHTQNIAHIGSWKWDIVNNHLIWSDEIYRIFGLQPQEFEATYEAFLKYVHPDDREFVKMSVSAALERRSVYDIEHRVVRPGGEVRFVREQSHIDFDGDGTPLSMIGVVHDITAQKLAEQKLIDFKNNLQDMLEEKSGELIEKNRLLAINESYLSRILNNIIDGLVIINEFGTIKLANPAAERTFGYPVEELIGKNVSMLMPEPYRSQHNDYLKKHMSTRKAGIIGFGREVEGLRKNGEVFPLDLAVNEMRFGEETFFLGILRDISQKKQADQELVRARDEAIKASQAKSEFLSRMSHELRTPMNAILGFAQLLELNRTLAEPQKIAVSQILKAGSHLLELINEVLDLSRIESGHLQIDLENVNLGEALAEVLQNLDPLAQQYKVSLAHEAAQSAIAVKADRLRLRQVLINLITNGIKYNKPGGSVALRIANPASDRVTIQIRDTGIGIPADRLSEIFEPFHRLNANKLEIEGTGVGLTVTKKLLSAMDGEIRVESEYGKGSCFTVELPAGEMSSGQTDTLPQTVTPPLAREEDSSQKLVLYIEDNADNIRLMREALTLQPHVRLLTVTRAREGIDLAIKHRPDLILMDITMPEMNGLDAFRELRNTEATKTIPVIGISANAMEMDVRKALDIGFEDYLTKPLNLKKLYEVLNNKLRN